MNQTPCARRCGPRARAGAACMLLGIALVGCASFRDDGGFDAVRTSTQPHLSTSPSWARTDAERSASKARVDELLAQPLDADGAVQVALLNNRGLQAAYAELGLADADVVQAGRLTNPSVSFGRTRQGGEVEHGFGVQLGIAQLVTMLWARPLAERRFEAVQRDTALAVLSLAHATRRAYYAAVAADESLQHLQRADALADAGAELAQRMAAAGNWNALQQAKQQSLRTDTALRLASAKQAQAAAREQLLRLLGLAAPERLRLPTQLPRLPERARELTESEQQAMDARLDLQRVRAETEASARTLGLAQATRFVNVLELGARRTRSNVEPTEREVEVRFELPLFDFGGARSARAESAYAQQLDRAADAAVRARSEVRLAYRGYRSHYDIARRYQDEVVPLRKRISDENLRRYNAMLIGVFDLLDDAREQIHAVDGSIGALRDFWLAQADLDMALSGPLAAPAAE